MARKPKPEYTPEALERLADLYVQRFKKPRYWDANPYGDIPRAPGTKDADYWTAYYDDPDFSDYQQEM